MQKYNNHHNSNDNLKGDLDGWKNNINTIMNVEEYTFPKRQTQESKSKK